MDSYRPHDYKFFERYKVAPPTVAKHGTEEDVASNMKQLKPQKWRMEGPGKLVGDTEWGPLVQFIDPSYICLGTNKKGEPILAKIQT